MDKTRTIGQKWLANELDLHFLTLKKCTKGQSNRSILSKVIVLTNYKSTDRQTDTFAKTIFSGSEGLKTWSFDKNRGGGGQVLHKYTNTFSDENIKSRVWMENSWWGGGAGGVLLSRVLVRSGRRKWVADKKKIKICEQSNGTGVDSIGKRRYKGDWRMRVWMFDVFVWSVLSCGVQIWGWKDRKSVKSLQERFLRWVMGVSWRCPEHMLREETGREKVVITQMKRVWNLEKKLRSGEGSKIAEVCLREISGRERRELGVLEVGKGEGGNETSKWYAGEGQRMEGNRRRNEGETSWRKMEEGCRVKIQ